jgi:hypothetical protein
MLAVNRGQSCGGNGLKEATGHPDAHRPLSNLAKPLKDTKLWPKNTITNPRSTDSHRFSMKAPNDSWLTLAKADELFQKIANGENPAGANCPSRLFGKN